MTLAVKSALSVVMNDDRATSLRPSSDSPRAAAAVPRRLSQYRR